MSSDDDYILGVADILLVVVGLVLHCGAIFGWGDDLAVHNSSVLGELEIDLVTIDIDGCNGQLIALFHSQRCAGGDRSLIVVVHQDLEKLLIGENILVVGLLEEYIFNRIWGVYVSCKVLVGHKADDIVGSPGLIVEVVCHDLGGVYDAIRLHELIALGHGCCQFLGLDVVIKIVVEAGKVVRGPGVGPCGDLPANLDTVSRSYCHRCCQ